MALGASAEKATTLAMAMTFVGLADAKINQPVGVSREENPHTPREASRDNIREKIAN